MRSHESYKYAALLHASSIRLFLLHPGECDDPLVGELQTFQLDAYLPTPAFEAISYVWGSSKPDHIVECDGKRLLVTQSLKNALQRVRHRKFPTYIWADAICIDQSNMRERELQVALMSAIFSEASTVSVCLSLHSGLTAENHETLAQIFENFDGPTDSLKVVHSPFQMRAAPLDRDTPRRLARSDLNHWKPDQHRFSSYPRSYWLLLAKFFDNSWFTRIWVVQEITESRSAQVYLGHQIIPWQKVAGVAKFVLRDRIYTSHILRYSHSNGIRNALFMDNKTNLAACRSIPAMLQSTRDFGASDPRDKVYVMLNKSIRRTRILSKFQFLRARTYFEFSAQIVSLLWLLSLVVRHCPTGGEFWYLMTALTCLTYFLRLNGLLKDVLWDIGQRFMQFLLLFERTVLHNLQVTNIGTVLSISADYTLTVHAVYRMVAREVMERSGKLDTLSYVSHMNDVDIDISFPSWVPRWDRPTNGVEILVGIPGHKYCATARYYHNVDPSPKHADHFEVKGICISTITSVSSIMSAFGPISSAAETQTGLVKGTERQQ